MHGRAKRLKDPQDWVLMTDGEACYRTFLRFSECPTPPRQSTTGRLPHLKYRIPRTLPREASLGKPARSGGGRESSRQLAADSTGPRRVRVLGAQSLHRRAVPCHRPPDECSPVRRSLAFAHCPQPSQALASWSGPCTTGCAPIAVCGKSWRFPRENGAISNEHPHGFGVDSAHLE
jgi:hypothetical protein